MPSNIPQPIVQDIDFGDDNLPSTKRYMTPEQAPLQHFILPGSYLFHRRLWDYTPVVITVGNGPTGPNILPE